jgi:hypothetical protein
MKPILLAFMTLLVGCTAAPPPSGQSLTSSLEEIESSLATARDYAQAHEHGSLGLYACEADVNLALRNSETAKGGVQINAFALGGDGTHEATNTIQIKLQNPDCNGKNPTPKGPP